MQVEIKKKGVGFQISPYKYKFFLSLSEVLSQNPKLSLASRFLPDWVPDALPRLASAAASRCSPVTGSPRQTTGKPLSPSPLSPLGKNKKVQTPN